MSDWAAKRFWKSTAAVETEGGYKIELDGRPVKTPAKVLLVLPTAEMAAAVASEWDAQVDLIDPLTMPVTRGANAAVDKVSVQKDEVVEMLAAYGDSDLLCYRAVGPEELIARQADVWDPLLSWAKTRFDVTLTSAEGVTHVPQNPENLARLHAELDRMTPYQIAAAHDLISLSGSLIIALAVIDGFLSAEQGWDVSRVDENWQFEQWGEDEDARALESIKRQAFHDAAKFYKMAAT
ncbi:chaperone required for assembly of F1-ATPase [Loktanella ponticola]|uniref:Chaperone required for assembly of F1-ATPase n=1 Tax=Yoonia ponticola TaxID=1524255 RepID=A0A7W9BHY5_9RHOB|nr:ATP12 family protein [Yoonia ponticola]MBB5720771.1 chaperone required for assembly of F1-ATPase [Yoonia ponticola]